MPLGDLGLTPLIFKVPKLNQNFETKPQFNPSFNLPSPFEGGAERVSTLAISGGGSVTFVANKQAAATVTISGGGSTVFAANKQGQLALSVSGGGSTILTVRKGGQVALTVTGGGSATLAVKKGAILALTITGGGSFTLTYTRSASGESHSGSLTISGGGGVTIQTGPNGILRVYRTVSPLGPGDSYDYEEVFGDLPVKEWE